MHVLYMSKFILEWCDLRFYSQRFTQKKKKKIKKHLLNKKSSLPIKYHRDLILTLFLDHKETQSRNSNESIIMGFKFEITPSEKRERFHFNNMLLTETLPDSL